MEPTLTTDSHAGQGPRHARVLPSFAAAMVGRPLECSLGSVQARELLYWQRSTLPTAGTAIELRDHFVKRHRGVFDVVWNAKINVKIVQEWRRAVDDTERLRLAPLVNDEQAMAAFPELTFRALKDAMRLSAAEVLGVLARLEALYWVPTAWRSTSSVDSQSDEDLAVDAEFLERMQVCLASPWVDALEPDDLRFPAVDGNKLAAWLNPQLQRPVLSRGVHNLCLRLLSADKVSWAQELAEIARVGIVASSQRQRSVSTQQRWQDIFVHRYGGLRGAELQTVGDNFGITRERVRQICDAILGGLREQPLKMPALERVLSAAGRILPLPMEEANYQLARFLGEGHGLEAALNFAEAMGLESPVRLAAPLARTKDGYTKISIVETAAEPALWVRAALAQARRDCSFVGCTNYVRIAGLLALEHGVAQDLQTLEAVLSKAPGYRLLDAESRWFTLADSETSAAATRMRKLMCVSVESVDIDTVVSALMTDDKWFYREGERTRDGGRALAMPPLHVLAQLFAGWDWLTANGHNKFKAKSRLDPNQLLSKAELGVIEVLEANGGVATRSEVAAHLVGNLALSSMAVSLALATSPPVHKLEHAIYAIRGRPLPVQALEDARKRRMAEQQSYMPNAELAAMEVDLSAPVRTYVNQSSSVVASKLRVVYLPHYLSGKLLGDYKHAGGVLPRIGVKVNNQIRMLSWAAEMVGIGQGERIEIVFDRQNWTYEILNPKTPSAGVASAQLF